MTFTDALALFAIAMLWLGIGLLLYVQVLGLLLRFHLALFPKILSKINQIEHQEANAK